MSINIKEKLRQRKHNPTTSLRMKKIKLDYLQNLADFNRTTKSRIFQILVDELMKDPIRFGLKPIILK